MGKGIGFLGILSAFLLISTQTVFAEDYYQDDDYDQYDYEEENYDNNAPPQGYYPNPPPARGGQPGYPPTTNYQQPGYPQPNTYQQPGYPPPPNYQQPGYPPAPNYNQPMGSQNAMGPQADPNREVSSVSEQEGVSEGHAEEYKNFRQHHIAILPGITTYEGDSDVTVGLEHNYRFKSMPELETLLLGEVILATKTTYLFAGGVTYRVWRDARLNVAGGGKFNSNHTLGLARVGASYEFHVSDYTVTPMASLDFLTSGETATFFGVAFGTYL